MQNIMKKAIRRGLLKITYIKSIMKVYVGISSANGIRKRKSHHKQQNEDKDVKSRHQEHAEAQRIDIVTNQSTESHFEKKTDDKRCVKTSIKASISTL